MKNKYFTRLAEGKFKRLNGNFPVVLVCGPRQVGKTTMLKHLSENENRTFVTLDDLNIRNLALRDPKLFFQTYKLPIIIDEIQFAPNLLHEIKLICDNNKKHGEFWLTGSQSYNIMKNITESLAGRIGILNMFSFTHQEILERNYETPVDFSFESLSEAENEKNKLDINAVFQNIFFGGMPKLIGADIERRNDYFESYVNSYLLRDVMELGKVSDIVKFNLFLSACASQISNVINYKNLALASNISEPTAKEWLEILQGMGIAYLIQPYFNNNLKRLTKTPKLYFYDTGLCAYLAKWPTQDSMRVSSMAGAYFENYCLNQIKVKYQLLGTAPNIYFYRDTDQREVDVVFESFDGLIPLEIKLTANPDKRDTAKFNVLERLGKPIKSGGILCLIDKIYRATEKHTFIPVGLI